MNKWMEDRSENREIINSCYSNPLLLRIEYPSRDKSKQTLNTLLVWQANALQSKRSDFQADNWCTTFSESFTGNALFSLWIGSIDGCCSVRYASDDEPKNHLPKDTISDINEVGRNRSKCESCSRTYCDRSPFTLHKFCCVYSVWFVEICTTRKIPFGVDVTLNEKKKRKRLSQAPESSVCPRFGTTYSTMCTHLIPAIVLNVRKWANTSTPDGYFTGVEMEETCWPKPVPSMLDARCIH